MKYKDFKTLSNRDMKQIMGGSADGGCACATLFTGGGTIAHCLGTQSHPHDCAAGSCTVGQTDCNNYCYKGTLSCWNYS